MTRPDSSEIKDLLQTIDACPDGTTDPASSIGSRDLLAAARQRALRPPDRRPRARRPWIAMAAVTAAACAAAVIAFTGSSSVPGLTATAYANTDPQHMIIYSQSRSVCSTTGVSAYQQVDLVDQWSYANTSRTLTTSRQNSGTPFVLEAVLDSQGDLHRTDQFNGKTRVYSVVNAQSGPTQRRDIKSLTSGAIPDYRRLYSGHHLSAKGTATFAGHKVRRYEGIDPGVGPRLSFVFYIDPTTKLPIGEQSHIANSHFSELCTIKVTEFRRLAPTQQNLRLLAPTLHGPALVGQWMTRNGWTLTEVASLLRKRVHSDGSLSPAARARTFTKITHALQRPNREERLPDLVSIAFTHRYLPLIRQLNHTRPASG